MSGLATALFAGHGIAVPVLLPLVSGALLLVLEKAGSRSLGALSLLATLAGAAVAAMLLAQAAGGAVQAYALGNWPAPFGITLALDRLGALMLVLTALVAVAAHIHALGGTARRGPHFHALFQFQLMGLNGAFLTADLFNLFVFFEVLLAASYGLLLHGGPEGGRARLKAGLHYVVFNLAGSALFLVAASLFYGVAGTLNMADLAVKLPLLPLADRSLALAAGGLLLVVFAVKAALLPLYFWLPAAYASATASVAALFVMLSKVGIYAIVRTATLGIIVLPPVLTGLALATLLLAALGALAAPRLRTLIAYAVVASAGTLMLAVGLGSVQALHAGLFYMVNSCFVAAACFLIAERISERRGGRDQLKPLALDGPRGALGTAFFIAAIAIAGLPPLAGFFGKAMLLQAAGALPGAPWVVAGVLLASLLMLVALMRAGSLIFWQGARGAAAAAPARPQHLAIGALLAATLLVAIGAGPVSAYTAAAAQQLHERSGYVAAVLTAPIAEPAFDVRREMRERGDSK